MTEGHPSRLISGNGVETMLNCWHKDSTSTQLKNHIGLFNLMESRYRAKLTLIFYATLPPGVFQRYELFSEFQEIFRGDRF